MQIYGWRIYEIEEVEGEKNADWLIMYNVYNQFKTPEEAYNDMFKSWEKFKKCPNYDENKGYKFTILPIDKRNEL